MAPPWAKFAILGSTYARALANAATRGGRALAPAMEQKLTQVAAQPQARLQSGLGQMFREHAGGGALAPTPQRQSLQDFLHRVPWTTDEHTGLRGGSDHGVNRFNQMLEDTGRAYTTPAGQPTTQQQITESFGRPQNTRSAPTRAGYQPEAHGGGGTQVGRPPDRLNVYRDEFGNRMPVGKSLMDIMDDPGIPTSFGRPPVRPPAGRSPSMSRPIATGMPTHVGDAQLRGAKPSPIPGMSAGAGDATAVLKTGAALPTAVGLGIPLAIGGGLLLNKPGIKADIADRLHNEGDLHQKDVSAEIPEPVMGQANAAAQALAARGINPASLRVAVDAPSGAGKTVLSRALAQQLGLRHHGLDWRPHMRMHQLMGGGDIEKTPYAPHAGEILEHQQLLRSYDPELFDVAIHINKSPDAIKEQLLHRGRGARTHDLLDYDKSIAVGNRAFDTLAGDSIDLGNGTFMKVRPQEGWGNALDEQLGQAGIDATGLSRHEKLLSLHAGKRTTGAGWTPYAKSPFSGLETAAIGASIPLGMMAARALRPRLP